MLNFIIYHRYIFFSQFMQLHMAHIFLKVESKLLFFNTHQKPKSCTWLGWQRSENMQFHGSKLSQASIFKTISPEMTCLYHADPGSWHQGCEMHHRTATSKVPFLFQLLPAFSLPDLHRDDPHDITDSSWPKQQSFTPTVFTQTTHPSRSSQWNFYMTRVDGSAFHFCWFQCHLKI